MNRGYFCVYRKMFDHWLWKTSEPLTRREAWLMILLKVNHTDSKILIEGTLYECKRGQALLSVKSWSELFNWERQKVRSFFKLLERDNMISTKGLKNTTMLTVCNYDIYNKKEPTDNQQTTISQPTDNQQTTISQPTDNQQTTTSKNNKEELKNLKKVEKENVPTPTVEKTQFLDFVFLKDSEYQKLVEKHGTDDTNVMIEKLNNFKAANGKKYASDYHAINNWVVEWLKEEKIKKAGGGRRRRQKWHANRANFAPNTPTQARLYQNQFLLKKHERNHAYPREFGSHPQCDEQNQRN